MGAARRALQIRRRTSRRATAPFGNGGSSAPRHQSPRGGERRGNRGAASPTAYPPTMTRGEADRHEAEQGTGAPPSWRAPRLKPRFSVLGGPGASTNRILAETSRGRPVEPSAPARRRGASRKSRAPSASFPPATHPPTPTPTPAAAAAPVPITRPHPASSPSRRPPRPTTRAFKAGGGRSPIALPAGAD